MDSGESRINCDAGVYCIHIRMKGGVYGKKWPEPKGVSKGVARGEQGILFSPDTERIPFLTMIMQ